VRPAEGAAMTSARALRRLDRLLRESFLVPCERDDRFVIFSDLHFGDGSSRDEFVHNTALFRTVLSDYYLRRGFKLVLNGDVEDLYKFPLRAVIEHCGEIYRLFDAFLRTTALYKIVGNHDADLEARHASFQRLPVFPALRLGFAQQEILVLHGHQAGFLPDRFNWLCGFLTRLAAPLGIRNGSVAYDEARKYRTEKRIYEFAKRHRIMAVIGHTHRPLFESLSRIDYLKFQIESLCRSYPEADPAVKAFLEKKIRAYQQDLQYTLEKDRKNGSRSSLYDSGRLVPCLFNSGCATGKRGITALEITGGRIALVFWFDSGRTRKYFNFNGYQPEPLGETGFFRVPLKEDSLDYVSTRIKLLA
jgi:predicted phosphodiesterase